MPQRQDTLDPEGSDGDSHDDAEGSGTGKKNASSTRKAQNRIAQREFRLRKQQYIRDLEARVEILSGDKEERVELTLLLVRNLLQENKELRNMLKQMGGFIAEGLGSCLPRLGLSAAQLDAILNRADTDTAYEAFVALKASKEMQEQNPGVTLGEIKRKPPPKRKRDSTTEGPSGTPDKGKGAETAPASNLGSAAHTPENLHGHAQHGGEGQGMGPQRAAQGQSDSYSYLFPNLDGSMPMAWPTPRSSGLDLGGMNYAPYAQNDPMRMFGMPSPMFQPPWAQGFGDLSGFGLTVPASGYPLPGQQPSGASGPSSAAQPPVPSTSSALPDLPPVEIDSERLRSAIARMVTGKGLSDGRNMTEDEVEERMRVQREVLETLREDEGMRKRTEPFQLITYHINNFRVNHAYVLPPSLRPTAVQRTIPHEHAIDGIPFPSIRDRMILLRGRYDLIDAYQGLLLEMNLRGGDPLDHRNWELSEKWLHDFQILADDEVYAVANRWRQERGESALSRPEQR